MAETLRDVSHWFGIVGFLGLVVAFGHSILAMSGEETLAQVYREVESPKLPNFKKAAFIVFVYSLLLTGIVSFLAVMMINDDLRMTKYKDNLLGGLAMQMAGPLTARLLLNGFVVVVGFLILSGAVNTSIIGSNGVLNRVAEDGVLPDWFLKPHRRFGTTSRILWLIAVLQLFTIIVSRGDVHPAGRSLRLWRGVEFCLQNPVDDGAALQGPHAARLQGPLQSPASAKYGVPDRPGHHLPDRLRVGHGQLADEGSRHDQRGWPSLRPS